MLSALISSVLSYAALPLMEQLPHHMYVNLGPLVLEIKPSIFLRPQWIRTELSHDVLNPARVPL